MPRRCAVRQRLQRLDDPIEARIRIDGPPVREHADDPRARPLGDPERTLGEPRLIGVRVLRSEDVLLEPLIDRGRVGQHALSTGDAIDSTVMPFASTAARARSTSSSVRSTMFLPQTTRSSAPVMPTAAMASSAVSRSGRIRR